ncbi:MAG TPA: amidohydrolase family protein [Vicinamibacterales bacterium]|jgi:N-acetylglucosamine-6-phosphate deacetylase|nr:amidohydrolase family protein [Vicinamibacterales bacterium]
MPTPPRYGFGGTDFNDRNLTADRVAEALHGLRATGVTRCLPTLVSSPLDAFAACAGVLSGTSSAAIAGIHMEGPYVSPEDGPRGAHAKAHVRPADIDDFKRRQDAANGRIVLVTLAPEVPGAIPLIEYLVASGVRVAIGHTAAESARISDAIAAGATLATHLGNGCAAMLPRHPNPIWDLLADEAVLASFIADGHHLSPATVKAMIRAKGPRRSVLITDATAAAGCRPGTYLLGDVRSTLTSDGRVSLAGTPYLAGSALTLERAIGNAVRFTGLPLDEVVPMASTIPAEYIGATPVGRVVADWDPATAILRVLNVQE